MTDSTATPPVEDTPPKEKNEDPKPKTFKQELSLWIFRSLLALIVGGVTSGATYIVSCGIEDARQKAAERSKVLETKHRQRALQLDLLKQIIEVAKKADFKDPTSLYQLGLISIMVNENEDVFGVRMNSAEMIIQQMFMQLSPINGIKRRLAESVALLNDMKTKLAAATEAEKVAYTKVTGGYRKLNDSKTPWWTKKKIKEELVIAERELSEQRLIKQFYLQQQQREEQNQEYFDDQLDEQERALKQALRNAELTQVQLKNSTDEFLALTNRLEKENPNAKLLADKLRVALKNLTRSSLQTDYTIIRLKSELEVRDKELQSLRQIMYELLKKYQAVGKACVPKVSPVEVVTPIKPRKKVTRAASSAMRQRTSSKSKSSQRGKGGGGGASSGVGSFSLKGLRAAHTGETITTRSNYRVVRQRSRAGIQRKPFIAPVAR